MGRSQAIICAQSKALIAQHSADILGMGHIAGFDHDLKFGLFQGDSLHHPLGDDLDDVRPRLSDDTRNR